MVSTAAFHARVRGSVPGLGSLKETKMFLPHPRVKVSIVGSLRDREVACSTSDRQGSNFESCVWRTVSSQSSQARFISLYRPFGKNIFISRGLHSSHTKLMGWFPREEIPPPCICTLYSGRYTLSFPQWWYTEDSSMWEVYNKCLIYSRTWAVTRAPYMPTHSPPTQLVPV